MQQWHPSSWRDKKISQAVQYPAASALKQVFEELCQRVPLVKVSDILFLQQKIGDAIHGQGFILQAGTCAERFTDCTPTTVSRKQALLNELSKQLSQALQLEVTSIGRIAGLFAKPTPSGSSPNATLTGSRPRSATTTASITAASAAPRGPRAGSLTSIKSAPAVQATSASAALRTLTSSLVIGAISS